MIENIYDAWDNGDRHEIRKQVAKREEIARMAREAGVHTAHTELTLMAGLERFAALVAAAEREKVARWQIGSGYTTGHGDTIEDLLVELEWQVRESEREACAKLCENLALEWTEQPNIAQAERATMLECAAAILARGRT